MAIVDTDVLLAQLKALWKKIELYPGRATVGWWLSVTNIVIVLIVVGGVSVAAIGRLKDLANAQGLARVQVAGAMAREDLRRYGESMVSSRVFSQKPEMVATLAKTLSERVGLDVRLIDYQKFIDLPVGPTTALHAAGLADGRSAAQRIESLDVYAASLPVFTQAGEAIALIEVRLPTKETDATVDQLVKRLLITAIVLALLAVLAGWILGRRVAAPVAELTDAAVKLGQGDFSTAIPTAGTAEVSQLARTMETMRHNLIELTETLRHREAQAQAMLGGISHEFRTPLAAQLASIELLRAGLGSMNEQQIAELVLSLERGVLRLTRLIDNLLENVRIESGQLAIRRQSIAIADVVEEAEAMAGALLAQRRQTLKIELPEDLPLIDGDRQRLAQVFVNLLANANKFAAEGTTVRIGAAREGDAVSAWVEDEGPGLPEISRRRIFERFYRAAGHEPAPSGLGLGLWICKSIVDRHGGTISMSRTHENRTRFTVTLPQAEHSEE